MNYLVFETSSIPQLTIDIAEQPHQVLLLDRLERDADDVAHKLPDGLAEAGDLLEELRIFLHPRPEQREVALLQDVRQVDDLLDRVVVHLGRQQQTLAQDKVRVREVGQRLEQNRVRHIQVHHLRVELVQLQAGQVRLQVVLVVLGLVLHVRFNHLQVFRIVPGRGEDDAHTHVNKNAEVRIERRYSSTNSPSQFLTVRCF